MPSLIDFISRVVPWPGAGAPGVVNHHWRAKNSTNGNQYWGGRPHTTPQSFVDLTTWAVSRPQFIQDIYFCLSLQSMVGKSSRGKPTVARSADNALALKAIWLDIDVKDPPKGYASKEEALTALDEFLKAAALPFPTSIVASGGGIHVYWISDRALSVQEWRPYAEGLKAAALQHALRCDAGLTTDCARILRVPQTFNFKTTPPKPVELLYLSDTDYDFAGIKLPRVDLPQSVGGITATVKPVFDLSGFSVPASMSSLSVADDHTSDGIVAHDNTPLDPTPILKGCPFFKDAFLTHGKNHGQPLWNLVILATTFWQKGETFAHELGNAHPGYVAADTDKMFERKSRERESKGLGWPSCAAIENEGCKLCATCAHKGKIKSPLNLVVGGTNVIPFAQMGGPQQALDDLMLPTGYGLKNGCIAQLIELPMEKGPSSTTLVPLFKSKVCNPWIEGGTRALHFTTSLDKDKYGPVMILDAKMATITSLMNELYAQGVLLNTRAEPAVREFIVSWKATIQERMEAQASVPFGWLIDTDGGEIKGFAYGGKIMWKANPDGTLPPDTPAGFGDPTIRRGYTPQGTRQPWIDCMKMIHEQNRPDLELIIASGFAAPLMEFVGKEMVTFAAYGESGAHKSSAMKIGAAIWGQPKYSMEVHTSTTKAVLKKIGQLKHIPLFWDELSNKETMRRAMQVMLTAGQGIEGNTLKSDRSSNERGSWRTCASYNLNASFVDFVADEQKNTEAGVYRVFEFWVTKKQGQMSDAAASTLLQKLDYNYGQIGLEYARKLVENPDAIRQAIIKHSERWADRLQATNPERNWVAAVTVLHFAALFANEHFLNAAGCPFHTQAIQQVLYDAFMQMRAKLSLAGNTAGSFVSVRDIMQQWFDHHIENIIWTNTMPTGRGKPKTVTVLYGINPNRPNPIFSQFSVEQRLLRINRKEFIRFLNECHYDPSTVIRGLRNTYGLTDEALDARIGAGTGQETQAQRVLQFDIQRGHPLEPMLYSKSPPAEKPDYLVEKETDEQALSPTGLSVQALEQAEKDLATVRKDAA